MHLAAPTVSATVSISSTESDPVCEPFESAVATADLNQAKTKLDVGESTTAAAESIAFPSSSLNVELEHFRRRQLKRKRSLSMESVSPLADPEGSPAAPAAAAKSTAAETVNVKRALYQFYCATCNQVQPADMFYPSFVQRRVYTCKQCSSQKLKKRKESTEQQLCRSPTGPTADPAAAAGHDRRESDDVQNMVQRFRRRCASQFVPQHWHGALPIYRRRDRRHSGLRLGFGVKVARMMLRFWQHRSALQQDFLTFAESEALGAASNSAAHSMTSTLCSLPPPQCVRVPVPVSSTANGSGSRRSCVARRTPLVFLLWSKTDAWPVQPWECIPVTRQEAAAFRKAPISMRADLLSTAFAARLQNRMHDLYQLCTSVPQSQTHTLITQL